MARGFGLSPFEILKENAEDVVLFIGYYIEKGNEEPPPAYGDTTEMHGGEKIIRRRVDDNTATANWY